ncbi:charged multivesicular body protein 3-like [Actinia tenebrosa]|uniref:Charged multivesicular body protein 3-like n=1 Tax=Actinia tenebrosa TaxID=6105 RepID=A0A6P8HLL0_ACTTE|nr:charged multivesicular body protein 3-like [Actinia tenebrosa]
MGLFGKTPQKTPKEQVREWCGTIRKEGRVLDRQIRAIQNEEAKVKRSIKDAAKKGDKDVCRILAKEIINSRKAINKMYASKAQLNSVEMSMKNQLATLRMAGALEKSTQVMSMMQSLIKIPQIQATMMELSKEMMKAGIIEEMLEDTFEGLEDDDMEEAADAEVEKILFEVTEGALGEAGHVTNPLPAGAEGVAEPEGEEEDLDEMRSRLEALRS